MIDVETIARKWANVYELALPADLEGGYDAANNRILISDRLTPIQRRCVLAHEISHARHHDVGCKCDSATERRADMEAARMLVNQLEYQSAEIIFDGDECAIARELNVMPWVIRAYKKLAARQRGCIKKEENHGIQDSQEHQTRQGVAVEPRQKRSNKRDHGQAWRAARDRRQRRHTVRHPDNPRHRHQLRD